MSALTKFKAAVKTGKTPAPVALRKDFVSVVAETGEDRRVKFTISTGNPDRDDDTVAVEGWDLEAYRKNPVVLWAHDPYALPIGKCVSIGVEGGSLVAEVEFLPGDTPERGAFAEAVLRMCRTGFLSTTSVGFRPLEFEVAKDRMEDDAWFPPVDFKRQELLEFSVVSIPANPEALIDPGERRAPVEATETDPAPAPEKAPAADEGAKAIEEAETKKSARKRSRDSLARRAALVALS